MPWTVEQLRELAKGLAKIGAIGGGFAPGTPQPLAATPNVQGTALVDIRDTAALPMFHNAAYDGTAELTADMDITTVAPGSQTVMTVNLPDPGGVARYRAFARIIIVTGASSPGVKFNWLYSGQPVESWQYQRGPLAAGQEVANWGGQDAWVPFSTGTAPAGTRAAEVICELHVGLQAPASLQLIAWVPSAGTVTLKQGSYLDVKRVS